MAVLRFLSLAIVAFVYIHPTPVEAELVVTEVMYDPASAEQRWEWFEVHNAGPTAIDLDGYIVDRVGDRERGVVSPNILASPVYEQDVIDNQTVVPAGGIAVLYNGPGLGYDPERFRAAWPSTSPGTRLIGVEGWSSNQLANRPQPSEYAPMMPAMSVGIWQDEASYRLDVQDFGTPASPNRRVYQTNHAATKFGYDDAAPWPIGGGAASLRYLSGNPLSPTSWARSNPPWAGAVTSRESFVPAAVNSPDYGSPGIAPPGVPTTTGLLVTELMYNPASTTGSKEWEWIELHNSGPTINFASTPHWLDDDDGSDLGEANVRTGRIESGGTAVLFNADAVELSQLTEAWDRPGQPAINWIAVDDWPSLANGGDLIGLWSNGRDYSFDRRGDEGSIFNAAAGVVYDDSGSWPREADGQSIWLTNLGAIPADPSAWEESNGAYADPAAYKSAEVGGNSDEVDNAGGDLGSPGYVHPGLFAPLPGDYNGDGLVNAADYTLWRDGEPLPAETATAGVTDAADYLVWTRHYRGTATEAASAASVPEPSTLIGLVVVAAIGCSGTRGRRLVAG